MRRIKEYIKDVYNELVHKVSWPTWSELQNSMVVVMVASRITSYNVCYTKLLRNYERISVI